MIEFKIDRSRTEGVIMDNIYFPSHFLGLICGWPGSGKTSLIKFILQEPKLLYEKYDEILLLSPSLTEWLSLCLPIENMTDSLDISFLNNHVTNYNKRKDKNKYINVLIIIDDLIADLTKQSKAGDFMKYVFNRRHKIDNGMISILMTCKFILKCKAQKFNMIPTPIRSNLTLFITYFLNEIDLDIIEAQIIRVDKKEFKKKIEYIFDDPKNFMIYRVDTNVFFKNFALCEK